MKRPKQILCALLLISICLCSCSFSDPLSADECRVTYSAKLIENDSVGDEWTTYLLYKEEALPSKDVVPYANFLTLYAYAREYDEAKPDSNKTRVLFNGIKRGEKVTKKVTVVVTENGGRYKGNKARWEFTITVERGK